MTTFRVFCAIAASHVEIPEDPFLLRFCNPLTTTSVCCPRYIVHADRTLDRESGCSVSACFGKCDPLSIPTQWPYADLEITTVSVNVAGYESRQYVGEILLSLNPTTRGKAVWPCLCLLECMNECVMLR